MFFENLIPDLINTATGFWDFIKGNNNPLTGDNGLFSNPSGAWDQFKNGRTNEINQSIAEENLGYQRERNKIEDARYLEEQAYNRAWSEEERAYQRALQQQIFEREDTALERQAASLSAMGINPAGVNMNGLGAGQAISAATAPINSTRGGSALHNDFQMTDQGILQSIAPIMEIANAVDNINTNGIQRDSTRASINLQKAEEQAKILDNERLALENMVYMNKNGIKKNADGTYTLSKDFKYKEQDFNENTFENEEASKNRNVREDEFQDKYGSHDLQSTASRIASDAVASADKAADAISDVVDSDIEDIQNSRGLIKYFKIARFNAKHFWGKKFK